MNSILEEDIKTIANSNIINWDKLKEKSIFITGATGLIGSILVKSLLYRKNYFNENIKLILLVRDKKNAQKIFGVSEDIIYIENSIENIKDLNIEINYIIHAASPTKSKFFIENPVETIDTSVIGTKNILEIAKNNKVSSFVYLSSMEMYGVLSSNSVTENDLGYINPLNVRSSYSEGKRMCELYSFSYFKEYNVPIKIARLAQTFGAGISKLENRVFKYFIDCILNESDIVLKSSGNTIVNFCYTTDSIIGILCILLNGKNGEAYNVVSEKTNMTIFESAKWLIEKYGNKNMNLKIEIPSESEGYAPDNNMILCNDKLKKIGWNCRYNLKDGYDRLIRYMKEESL